MIEDFRTIAFGLAAIPAALLPQRYWPDLPSFPIRKAALLSAILTIVASAVIGLGGFLAYNERVGRELSRLTVKVAEAQLQRRLPSDSSLNSAPLGVAALTPFAFAFFTPVGLLATYLLASGFARAASCIVDEPFGDPILTGVDTVMRRIAGNALDARRRCARERAEGAEVPDRLYPADWAGVADADFVVVASRRKPQWDKGTFVITAEKWYVLGAPFDMQLPEGLRTIYPIKEHTTHDVLRRGVSYELPALRKGRGPKGPRYVQNRST
jgi:hypothetical protein